MTDKCSGSRALPAEKAPSLHAGKLCGQKTSPLRIPAWGPRQLHARPFNPHAERFNRGDAHAW